jgi:nitrogen permease regulator 3-like protein
MAAPVLPNSSNFLGVALVINRSRDGPRFVFHYPPQIPAIDARPSGHGEGGDPDDDDALVDGISNPAMGPAGGSLPKGVDLANWKGTHDDHLEAESGSQIVPWEHVGGFPTRDLRSILTPARPYHKKLFTVTMDQLVAVSCPIHVPENGVWKKKKRQPKSRPGMSTRTGGGDDGSPMLAANIPQIETQDTAEDAETPDPADMPDDPISAEEKKSGMTMFNLVFLLNPKKHETKELVDTTYVHILRKINKLYKYAQQRSDFVWKESKRILQLKDKAREEKTKLSTLWRHILETSSLAASMQDIYEAVCANKIVALQLDTPEGTVAHSVQIPVPFHLPDLPGTDDVQAEGLRGLWITTANNFADTDVGTVDDPTFLDKTFGLLLLHNEKKIITELQTDPEDSPNAMVEFVRLSKPTLSFHNIGQGPSLSPTQVRKYAQHFIYWRRAIAVPPLHARDVYIMSPNSKTSSLPKASQAWARAFPLAPPLPNFLAELSAAPRPYKFFAPSKNHRPQYLQMLAWLMRGGWVTQLCTFAYVVVWPEIQYEVEYQIEADEIRSAEAIAAAASGEQTSSPSYASTDHEGGMKSSDEGEGDTDSGLDKKKAAAVIQDLFSKSRPASPDLKEEDAIRSPILGSSYSSASQDADLEKSIASLVSPKTVDPLEGKQQLGDDSDHDEEDQEDEDEQPQNPNQSIAEAARLTRLADRASRARAERSARHARKQAPMATEHPSTNRAPHLAHLTPYVILDAKKATGRESMYLSAIGRRFRDSRVRASWPVFWKHFNGRVALERVCLMEDLKRKEAWALLTAMSEHLVTVRHW